MGMFTIQTIGELREAIEFLDDETPVSLAIQPTYPFAHGIAQVVTVEDEDGKVTAWIAEGGQTGYLAGNVRDELGW